MENDNNALGVQLNPTEKDCSRSIQANIQRETAQYLAVVIFDHHDNQFEKFRNAMVMNVPIAHAYGRGTVTGVSGPVRTLSGFYKTSHRVCLVCFDNERHANGFADSRLRPADAKEFSGQELYLVPCSNPVLNPLDYPHVLMECYDIRNGQEFTSFLKDYQLRIQSSGGVLIVGSSQIGKWMPQTRPMFILISQWRSEPELYSMNRSAQDRLGSCGATIVYRTEFCLCPIESPVSIPVTSMVKEALPKIRQKDECPF